MALLLMRRESASKHLARRYDSQETSTDAFHRYFTRHRLTISAQTCPDAVLAPDQFARDQDAALPLCLLLLGAGGTRDSIFDLQPLFDEWWAAQAVPAMVIAIPTSGLDYYMEDPAGSIRWDSFLAGDFLPHLRSARQVSETTVIAGISGGGYGALKLAFARPHCFAAVAAMQPMLEPGLHGADVGPRNRLHHSAGGPPLIRTHPRSFPLGGE